MFLPDIADVGAFYERAYQQAFRTALGIVRNHAVAADVTQDAFVVASEQRARFRGDAPGVVWIHRIVVNGALAAVRRRGPVVRDLTTVEESGADHSRATADRVVLFAALGDLPPRYRAVVVLRYYHDYDYATIARILGTLGVLPGRRRVIGSRSSSRTPRASSSASSTSRGIETTLASASRPGSMRTLGCSPDGDRVAAWPRRVSLAVDRGQRRLRRPAARRGRNPKLTPPSTGCSRQRRQRWVAFGVGIRDCVISLHA